MPRLTLRQGANHLFWEASVEGATLTVRYGRVGQAGQSQTRELASPEAAELKLAKKVRQKVRKGYVEAVPVEAEVERTNPEPDWPVRAWFEAAFPEEKDLGAFERLTGRPAPHDVRRFGLPGLAELDAAENTFEALRRPADETPDALEALFAASWPLGIDEVTGSYLLHFPPGAPPLVVLRDHDSGVFGPAVATDLAALLYVRGAFDRFERDHDGGALRQRLEHVAGVVRLGGSPFDAWLARKEVAAALGAPLQAPPFDAPVGPAPLARRAAWLVALLSGGRLRPELVGEDELERDPAASLKRPSFPDDPAEALYWLWRSYFLREDDRLAAILDRLAPARARLVKDAAALVGDLASGKRTELPGLGAMAALRSRAATELPEAVRARVSAAREQRLASLRSPSGVTLERLEAPPAASLPAKSQPSREGGALEAIRAREGEIVAEPLPDGRVLALKTVDLLLFDAEARLLARAHGGDPSGAKEMYVSADGRLVVCFSPRPPAQDDQRGGPAPVRVIAVIESSLVPLATFALRGFAIDRVDEEGGRLHLTSNQGDVFTLAGLEEALARDREAYARERRTALERAADGSKLVLMRDRARPAPPAPDYPEVLEGTPHRLELRYESSPGRSGYRLALVNGSGERRLLGSPDDLLPQAQFRLLSPDRRHALIGSRWRLLRVDLESGRLHELLVCALNAAAYLADDLVLAGDFGVTAARRRLPDPGPDGTALDVFGRTDLAADPTLHVVDLAADAPAISRLGCFVLGLSTLLGGRVAVVSRFADKGWNTAILGVKDRKLVVLAKLQEELGTVWEQDGRVFTEHGEEILNLQPALVAADASEGPPDLG